MQSSEEISLSEILHTLKKWKKHIFIFSFLVFAVIFSLQTLPKRGKKIYKATAVIRVTHESSLPLVLSTLNLGVRPIKINLSYEADSIKSDKNLKEAIKILGWSEKDIGKLASMIEVSYSERDNTISVSAYTDDPMRSKEVADAVARAYVGISRQRFEEIIDSSMEYLKASAEDVSKRLRLSYDSLASLVQDTGVVDPRTQIQERVRRIEDIREEIYKTEYKIQMLEKFLMDISRNKEMTRERIGDRNRIFERDGLPMGREAVEVLKGRIGDLMSIDEGIVQQYRKYLGLERKREELIKMGNSEDHPRVKEIDKEIEKIFGEIVDSLRFSLAQLRVQRESLMRAKEVSREEIRDISRYISDYMYIGNNIEIMNSFFENYYSNYVQMKIAAGLWSSYAEIYREAEAPSVPVRRIWKDLLISLMVSVLGGIIFGFLLESTDRRFKSAEDLSAETGVPVIGVIGRDDGIKIGGDITSEKLYEDFRRLKVGLQMYKERFTVGVVSSLSGEGKSSVVWGLGKVLGDYGYRVGIVDMNLRHPEISEIHGVDESRCISGVLSGVKRLEDVEVEIGGGVRLYGVYVGNMLWGQDMFMSSNLGAFMMSLRERNDYVIVDTSPILMVSDTLMILKNLDLVLVVYDLSRTEKKVFKRLVNSLKEAGVKNLRCVVNKVPREYEMNYYYYYASDKNTKRYYYASNSKNDHRNNKQILNPRSV